MTVPLDGPVIGGGWWIRVGYVATGSSPMTVTAGNRSFKVVTESGVHSLFLEPSGDFDSVRLSGLRAGVQLCTNDVTLGTPKPFGGSS